jgi:hypothetical protein
MLMMRKLPNRIVMVLNIVFVTFVVDIVVVFVVGKLLRVTDMLQKAGLKILTTSELVIDHWLLLRRRFIRSHWTRRSPGRHTPPVSLLPVIGHLLEPHLALGL